MRLHKENAFRRCTWRQGSRRAMTAQFARVRVRVGDNEHVTLLIDHYEGRSYPGWHHHVSVVLSSYAFIVAERNRLFPPPARRTVAATQNALAPRAPFPGQLHHCPACGSPAHRDLATEVSGLPSPEHEDTPSEGLTQ